jgi:iron complex transport system substrate-binding protein
MSSRAVVLCTVLALGCEGSASKQATRTASDSATSSAVVRDDFGQAIRSGSAPKRIVSLNPTTTEILFAIGAGSRLVGRTKWDSWPDSAKLVPDIGDALRPNIEAVLQTHPDLVILYASTDNRPAADRLRAAGIETVALRVDSIAQFRRAALLLGRLTGESARAQNVVDSVQRTLDGVRAATATLPRTSVFFHTWDKPLITIGGNSFLNELVVIAGGRNVYEDIAEISPVVTLEDVVKRNPDALVVGPIAAKAILASTQWQAVPAVRAKRVFVYDTNIVGRPSVTLGMAAVNIANLLHPGVLESHRPTSPPGHQ